MPNKNYNTVGWKTLLKKEQKMYAHLCTSKRDYRRIKRYRRVWRRIFSVINPNDIQSVLEVGVGGGKQLIPLALNGKRCVGIDCSEDVLERAAAYKKMVEYYHGSTLDITFVCGDWLSRDIEAQIDHEYDLIFNFGVIEHYLTEEERINFLHKKLGFLRSGGYLVSYVPSGIHPFRFLQVQNGWGGYVVPETNYNAGQIRKEGELSGATDIVVLPHNYFGYLTMIPSSGFRRFLHRGTFLVAQLFPSKLMRLLPDKYAKEFLLIARKP